MVKYEPLQQQSEGKGDEEKQVRGIAGVDHVDPAGEPNAHASTSSKKRAIRYSAA